MVPLAKALDFSGFRVQIHDTDSRTPIQRSEMLVLPGIGKWDHSKNILDSKGLSEEIRQRFDDKKKIFGVCLGMQLMARDSEEGKVSGLGLLDCSVRENRNIDRVEPSINNGWKQLRREFDGSSPEDFNEIEPLNDRFYFSHSYSYSVDQFKSLYPDYNLTMPEGRNFVASFYGAILAGVQFHPERSHRHGIKFLEQLRMSWFR